MIPLVLAMLMGQDHREILADIEDLDGQVAAVEAEVASLDAKVAATEGERRAHADALQKADADLAARRAQTSRALRTLYRLQRRGFARLLFDAESPAELRRRVHYLLGMVATGDSETRAYLTTVDARKTAQARLDADLAAWNQARSELQVRLAALEEERRRRAAYVREVRSRPELVARVEQEREVAARAVTVVAPPPEAPAGDAASFRASKGRLPSPVAGSIVRGFGPYSDPETGVPGTNLGVDYAAPLGSPFRAVADGVVTRSGYLRGYGQMVLVQHGPYATLYAHANGLRVAQGQAVRQGDVLGLVGNTGLAEDADARLHFEVRYNNTPQDPAEWLGRR